MAEQLNIADIKIGKRFRKDLGDIDALAASIQERGALLQPIVISSDYSLIGGMRRLTAVKKLGWSKVPVHVVKNIGEAVELLKAERDENTCRKPYTPTECVEIGEAIEQMLKPKMKERQRQHGGTAPGKSKNTSSNLDEVNNGNPAKASEDFLIRSIEERCKLVEQDVEKIKIDVAFLNRIFVERGRRPIQGHFSWVWHTRREGDHARD